MPAENIQRNIKKASSSKENYIEVIYELYGYGKVGIIVDIMTDNKNRISAEINMAINRCGGKLAKPGAVLFNFEKKGVLQILIKQVFSIFNDVFGKFRYPDH